MGSLPLLSPAGFALSAGTSQTFSQSTSSRLHLDAARPHSSQGLFIPEAHCSPRSEYSGHPYSQLLRPGFPRKKPCKPKKGVHLQSVTTTNTINTEEATDDAKKSEKESETDIKHKSHKK